MTTSDIEKKIKRWTLFTQCCGALAAIGVGVSIYLEGYFNRNPTVEDLYYGTNSRNDTLWSIALPMIGICTIYVFLGSFKIFNLRKQLPHPDQPKTVVVDVKSGITSKTDELTKLSKLRTEGVLSDSEFELLKKEIIG